MPDFTLTVTAGGVLASWADDANPTRLNDDPAASHLYWELPLATQDIDFTCSLLVEPFTVGYVDTSGLVALPHWLSITCATTGRTAQQSAQTVKSGYAANTARAFSRDGVAFGLLLEPSRTNELERNSEVDNAVWTKQAGASVSSTTVADPAGGTTADRVNWTTTVVNEGFFHTNPTGSTAAVDWSISHWLKWKDVTSGDVNMTNAAVSDVVAVRTITNNWGYVTWGEDVPGGFSMLPWVRKTASSDSDVDHWGAQAEVGKYPTSIVPTAAADVTRAADVLRAEPAALAPGGYFTITLKYRPHYAHSEAATAHDLVFFDASNRFFFRESDAKMVLKIGGVDLATAAAVTFSRHQEITVTIEHTATRRAITVSGATSGNGTVTAAAASAMSLPTDSYVFGSSTGSQEGADLRAFDAGSHLVAAPPDTALGGRLFTWGWTEYASSSQPPITFPVGGKTSVARVSRSLGLQAGHHLVNVLRPDGGGFVLPFLVR